jgi:HK97 family phage prohead protease
MPELIHTDPIEAELTIRADDERTIWGRIVPYGQQIRIGGRPESFSAGSFDGLRADDVTLFYHHDHLQAGMPIGRGYVVEQRSDGLYMGFRVAQTQKGDEALQLAREGVLRSFSPGFIEQARTAAGVITRALMREVSLTPFPAYDRATVLAVRDDIGGNMPEENTPTIEPVAEPTAEPVVEYRADPQLTESVEDLRVRMERLQTAFDSGHRAGSVRVEIPSGAEWLMAEIRSNLFGDHGARAALQTRWAEIVTEFRAGNLDELQTRALADVTGAFPENSPADDASGVVQQTFMAAQLVSVLDSRRPFFANVGRIEMPESGYAQIPRVSQHTVVEARGAQKTEIPSQAMIITVDDYAAGWLAGGVDIALELLRTASLNVFEMVWADLVGQYARATEHDPSQGIVPIIDAGITGATYTGAVLPVNTYAAFIAAVLAAADSVEDATGAPATDLFLPRALFNDAVELITPLAFTARGDNDGATIGLTAQGFTLPGGIDVHKVKDLDQAILTNDEALKVADSGPEQVTATNVALMGRDLGLLGRTLVVPRIPAGIVYFEAAPGS